MVSNLQKKKIDFPSGTALACIYGSTARANDDPYTDGYLSSIGVYTLPIQNEKIKKHNKSIDANPSNPRPFDDFTEYQNHGCKYPSEIRISYGVAIDNIQFIYPGNVIMPKHGHAQGGEHFKTLTFAPCEHIIGLKAMVGTYKQNRFIYDLSLKLESTWIYVGISNTPTCYTDVREIIIDFPSNYCLGCVSGKTARANDDHFSEGYLSSLDAYILPIELENSKLYWYSQNVRMTDHLSHTGVYTDGDYSSYFGCNGTLPLKKEPEYYEKNVGNGNVTLAQIIATGDIYTVRDNCEYTNYKKDKGKPYGKDNCGIDYMYEGVCHQMINRLLYSCKEGPVTLDPEHVRGYKLSLYLYGVYGKNWDTWRDMCLYLGIQHSGTLLEAPAPIVVDEFTKKILEIDNSLELTEEEKIIKRFSISFADTGSKSKLLENDSIQESLNDAIRHFAKLQVYYMNLSTGNNIECENRSNAVTLGDNENISDAELEEKTNANIQEFLKKCHKILGDEEFKNKFGFIYYPEFKLSDF